MDRGRRWCSRWSRHSGPGRASAGPSVRRSAATPGASTSRLVGVGAGSLRKSSTSSRLGSRPVRSSADAANQRRAVGLGATAQAFLFEPGQDEAIDGVAQARRVFLTAGSGAWRGLTKAQCGEYSALGIHFFSSSTWAGLRRSPASAGGMRVRRHRCRGRVEQLAGLGPAGDDDLAFGGPFAQVETQAAFLGGGAVALEAVIGQERPDVALEIDVGLPRAGAAVRRRVRVSRRQRRMVSLMGGQRGVGMEAGAGAGVPSGNELLT